MIETENLHKIYFVGIGGIAMSATACLAKQAGYEVSGSDCGEIYAPAKDVLADNDIGYFAGYDPERISQATADLFVISAGENESNPEVERIVKLGLKRAGFPELLEKLAEDKLRVVVAGTHGKSTTAGLLGHLLKNADDSSFMVGAVLQNYESNFYLGEGHYFVFEGDEYKTEFDDPTPKFHYYKPDILILTNLEHDHPDLFPDFEDMRQEFALLVSKLPEDGLIVYNADDIELKKLVHESNVASVGFGFEDGADFQITRTEFGGDFTTIYILNKLAKDAVSRLLEKEEEYKIRLPGMVNVGNAAAAIAALRALGFQRDQLALELMTFSGVKRRFEEVGKKNGVVIIDDYAHHPTAVKLTLEAARQKFPNARIWAVFEPHTFSRTYATLSGLAAAFTAADEVLVSEIYPAREKKTEAGITSAEVVDAIRQKNAGSKSKIRLVRDKQEALGIIKAEAKPGDAVIVMAVGAFNRLAYELKDIL